MCEVALTNDPCRVSLRAFIACVVAAGPDALTCMDGAHTILQPGMCRNENDTLIACARGQTGG